MTRRLWIVNLLLAVGCSTIGGLDLATGHPMLAPLMFASAGVNGLVGAFNKRHYARPPEPAHRPDYAKIRRLELELGLADPPQVDETVRRCTVCRGKIPSGHLWGCPFDDPGPNAPEMPKPAGGPFLRHSQPRYQSRPRVVPPAVTSPSEWSYCPVCTRRHAGRCAG